MRNFIFFTMLLFSSMAFSQELVMNGDFETGDATGWVGNAANVVTEDGNSYNAANVMVAGNPWDVNLSQVLELTEGVSYRLVFDAWSDTDRTIIAGIGLNEAPWTNVSETVTLATTSQNYDITFVANFGSANSRVIFDMGADVGFVGIDNVSLTAVVATCDDGIQNGDEEGVDCGGSCPPCAVVEPMTAAPTPPTRAAEDVISIYGDAYGTAIGINNVEWDGATNFTEENIAGENMLKMNFDAFLGSDLGTVIDATDMMYFHMDVWIADDFMPGQVFNTKFSNHTGGAGETDAGELTYAVGAEDARTWVSIDVPLTDFANVAGGGIANREAITQFLITVAATIDLAYVDNIYLYRDMVMSTNNVDVLNNALRVYPNPVAAGQKVVLSENAKQIEVYNINGALISRSANANTINTAEMEAGVYLLKITTKQGALMSQKLIVK